MNAVTEPPVEQDAPEGLHEAVDGLTLAKPLRAAHAAGIAFSLRQHLGDFARTEAVGCVASELRFELRESLPKRRPELAFVSVERRSRERKVAKVEAWNAAPDWAIEVFGPSNSVDAMRREVNEYLDTGGRRDAVVYPGESPDEAVLPGFRMPIDELFEVVKAESDDVR